MFNKKLCSKGFVLTFEVYGRVLNTNLATEATTKIKVDPSSTGQVDIAVRLALNGFIWSNELRGISQQVFEMIRITKFPAGKNITLVERDYGQVAFVIKGCYK